MNLRLNTRYEEMCLVVKVAVTMPTKVRIKIYDEEKPKIVFTNRYKTVNSDYTFYSFEHVVYTMVRYFYGGNETR